MDWLEIASYGLADAKGIVPYRMNRGHADHTFPTFLVDISRQQPRQSIVMVGVPAFVP